MAVFFLQIKQFMFLWGKNCGSNFFNVNNTQIFTIKVVAVNIYVNNIQIFMAKVVAVNFYVNNTQIFL